MSPLKKKLETITKDIYTNIQENYKEAAAQESAYKGEGTAEYYKSQHVLVPPPQIIQQTKGGPVKLVPRLRQGPDGPVVSGICLTNRILLHKGTRPG